MKKTLTLVLAILLIALTMVACGSSEPPAQEPSVPPEEPVAEPSAPEPESVQITIWHENDAVIADTIQQQLAGIPGVNVTLERKEQMSDALKMVGNDPNSAPDMYLFAHDKIGVFAEMGILAPVIDLLPPDAFANILPMAIDATTYKGNQYSAPLYFETLLFMYNKDLMATPPATTDELLDLMENGTTANSYVFAEQHSTAYYAAAWIQGFGGYIINENAEPGLGSNEVIDAMTYHKSFIPYMPLDGEYNTVTTLFSEGMAASTIGGPWMVPGLRDVGMNLGISTMPVLPNGNPLTPFSGIQAVQVLNHAATAKQEAVEKVLAALLDPEVGIALAKAANCAPVNILAYDDPEVSSNEMIIVMRDTAANVIPMPNVPEMDVMWTVTDNMLASINKNNQDVASTCEGAQTEAIDLIEAMQ